MRFTLQTLPPANARLCLRVKKFLSKLVLLEKKTKIVVAFSGGADSTALAVILQSLGFDLLLAHLNHNLRKESHAEAQAAQEFAQKMGMPFFCAEQDIATLAKERKSSLEEAGRFARYAFLEKTRSEHNANWIATGHHLDDLCEDQLMRLIRGTGWPALGGMQALNTKRHLLRPLLCLKRQELRDFLTNLHLTWQEDLSNQDVHFTRNRIRHNIVPLLEKENPAFTESAFTLWELARLDQEFWSALIQPVLDQIVKKDLPQNLLRHLNQQFPQRFCSQQIPQIIFQEALFSQEAFFLPRTAMKNLPPAARLRVFLALIRQSNGQARAETIQNLDSAFMANQGIHFFQFPSNLLIVVCSGKEGGIYLLEPET